MVIDTSGNYSRVKRSLVSSTHKVIDLRNQLQQYREGYAPQKFETLDDFKAWVARQKLSKLKAADWERAEAIQAKALKDGYLITYQIVINVVTGVEFWPITKIGDKIYCIQPVTNQVTLYYPREEWLAKEDEPWKLPKLPQFTW